MTLSVTDLNGELFDFNGMSLEPELGINLKISNMMFFRQLQNTAIPKRKHHDFILSWMMTTVAFGSKRSLTLKKNSKMRQTIIAKLPKNTKKPRHLIIHSLALALGTATGFLSSAEIATLAFSLKSIASIFHTACRHCSFNWGFSHRAYCL